MADTDAPRYDSACSEDSAFGEDTALSQGEFVQRRLEKMRNLMGAGPNIDEGSAEPWHSAPSSHHTGSNHSDAPISANMTVYEKLQALALAENIKLDEPVAAEGGHVGSWPPVASGNDANEKKIMPSVPDEEEEEDEEDEDETYEIEWDGGPLGLLFKASTNGQAVIRRVNKKGAATGLQYARAGDVLVALDGASVSNTPFSEVIDRLKHPEFPIKLEFRPLKLSDLASTAASSAGTSWAHTPSSAPSNRGNPAFCGSPVSSNTTVDMRSQRDGGGDDTAAAAYMPSLRQGPPEASSNATDVEYDVVWSEGPLGCELKQRNGLPAVKSVTGTGVTPSVAQIAAGDILVSINGLRTEEIGFKSTVTLMMRATKPVYLRFHRGGARQPPSTSSSFSDQQSNRSAPKPDALPPPAAGTEATALEPKQYTVLWREGPLGIQIRTSSKGRVVVARLTGAGAPEVNDTVTPGDIFVRVAGVDVDSLGIAGAFELLKTVQKPVVLVFQRRSHRTHSHGSRPRSRSRSRRHGLPSPVPSPAPLPSSGVPSFRQLREDEAAAAAAAVVANGGQVGRPPMSRAYSGGYSPSPSQRNGRGGSLQQGKAGYASPNGGGYGLEPYAASDDGASQRSYDYSGGSPRSSVSQQQQYARQQRDDDDAASDNGVPNYPTSLPPPPPFPSEEAPAARAGDEEDYPEEDSFPPQEVASGDESPTLTGLAPPPSYLDIFTASGRAKDALVLPPRSTHNSNLQSIYDNEPSAPTHPVQEFDGDYYAETPLSPPAFPGNDDAPMPPPPTYPTASLPPTVPTPASGNPASRLQELRRQYIESERQRNVINNENGTVVSSYSDIDDSGLVIRHHRGSPSFAGAPLPEDAPAPSPSPSPSSPQLPLPELWVRWSDGPLGITFKRKHGQIVVSRLTGSGYSPGLTQLRAGDWLVAFNNQSTRDLRLGETMELLKRSPKPVDMCFVVQ